MREGRYVRLERLNADRHTEDLWQSIGRPDHNELWRWMHAGPFTDREAFHEHIAQKSASSDPLLYALIDIESGRAAGHAALMRDDKENRVIEVGNIVYGPALQRSRMATEAMYLLARHVFEDMGYRRYEWKCNARNEPSRRAALRLGFTFEGVFRQHMMVKGMNRDTAWFSMLDSEWPRIKAAFEAWLHPSNFDAHKRQIIALSARSALSSLDGIDSGGAPNSSL